MRRQINKLMKLTKSIKPKSNTRTLSTLKGSFTGTFHRIQQDSWENKKFLSIDSVTTSQDNKIKLNGKIGVGYLLDNIALCKKYGDLTCDKPMTRIELYEMSKFQETCDPRCLYDITKYCKLDDQHSYVYFYGQFMGEVLFDSTEAKNNKVYVDIVERDNLTGFKLLNASCNFAIDENEFKLFFGPISNSLTRNNLEAYIKYYMTRNKNYLLAMASDDEQSMNDKIAEFAKHN
jgi:hypothetical protein